MGDPRTTGISSITGKIVYIRHADDADRVNIAAYFGKHKRRSVDTADSDVVVAVEEERLIGFGILDHGGTPADIILVESGRRRGIGAPILRHLMEDSPVKEVHAGRESAHYLERLGFHRVRIGPGRRPIYARADRRSRASTAENGGHDRLTTA